MRIKDVDALPDSPLKRGLKAQLEAEGTTVVLDSKELAAERQTLLQVSSEGVAERPRHKFGAVATERDGMRFDSKAEARFYDELKLRQAAGEVVMFLRQVPFHLPGGGKYVCDFLVFEQGGTVRAIDVKGVETSEFRTKKRLVEALYPLTIEVVKS